MPRPNPVILELLRLLRDGEWHDREWVYQKLMTSGTMHPGQAARTAEEQRKRMYAKVGIKRQDAPPRKRPMPLSEQVRIGKREFARRAMHNRPWLEYKREEDPPRVLVRCKVHEVPPANWRILDGLPASRQELVKQQNAKKRAARQNAKATAETVKATEKAVAKQAKKKPVKKAAKKRDASRA